jgi:hypothetical protein
MCLWKAAFKREDGRIVRGRRRTVTEVVANEVKILDSASKNRCGEPEEQTTGVVGEDAPF